MSSLASFDKDEDEPDRTSLYTIMNGMDRPPLHLGHHRYEMAMTYGD